MKPIGIKVRPWCPFCGQEIGRPREPEQRDIGEFTVGDCQCGAVYTCDPTGFRVGAAMVDCIVYACKDWDMAWELLPEEDYLVGRVEKYDEQTHQVIEEGVLNGRIVKGVLFFVRLHKDVAEIAERKEKREKDKAEFDPSAPQHIPEIEPERDPNRTRKRAKKGEIKKMVEAWNIDGLVDLAFDDMKTTRFMQRLLYTPDEDFKWQTAFILGKVCARIATRKPGKVSDLLQRLFLACSDSAAAHWGLVEAIGSIIKERTDILGAFTRHLLKHIGDDSTRMHVLWALGSIAEVRPDLIRATPFFHYFSYLDHSDPETRGQALRLLGRTKATEVRSRIQELFSDHAEITIYEEGRPVKTTISELAENALTLIDE